MKHFRKSFFFIPPPVRFLPNNKKNKYNPARIGSIKKSLQAVGCHPLSSYITIRQLKLFLAGEFFLEVNMQS